MKVVLLYFDDCPNYEAFLPHLRELLDRARVETDLRLVRVDSPQAAKRERFLGSPTVRVNGVDVEPGANARRDFGMKCRLYRTSAGLAGIPADNWILEALSARSPDYTSDPQSL
jgi:hypothetical protein